MPPVANFAVSVAKNARSLTGGEGLSRDIGPFRACRLSGKIGLFLAPYNLMNEMTFSGCSDILDYKGFLMQGMACNHKIAITIRRKP